MAELIVKNRLAHNGRLYCPGDVLDTDTAGMSEETVRRLQVCDVLDEAAPAPAQVEESAKELQADGPATPATPAPRKRAKRA